MTLTATCVRMTSFSGKLFPRGSRGNPNVICVFLLPSPSCFFTFRPCSAGFASQARRFFYKKYYKKRIRRKLACRRIRFIVIRPKMRTKKTYHARLRSPNFGRLAKAAHGSKARRFCTSGLFLFYPTLCPLQNHPKWLCKPFGMIAFPVSVLALVRVSR